MEAYIINKTGEQALPESPIFIACDPAIDEQSDGSSTIAQYVVSAAKQYCITYAQNAIEDLNLCERLQEDEILSKVIEAGVIVCAFDLAAEASLSLVMSTGIHISETHHSTRGLADCHSLRRFLEKGIWAGLANIWDRNTDVECKFMLFSGKTCVSLNQFKDALHNLVDDNVTQDVMNIEALKRTIFWRSMMKLEDSPASAELNYTWRRTFPRRSEPAHSRHPSLPEFWRTIPRNMPG